MAMRALALSLAFVGLFVLCYSFFSSPREVISLQNTTTHDLVLFSGKAHNERIVSDQHYFSVGNISVRCSCASQYVEGKEVTIVGFVETYDSSLYVRALKLVVH
jgi:hypothetical protein